jgi:hypothetical protein
MAKTYCPPPPIALTRNALPIYQRIIRQLGRPPAGKVDKAATVAHYAHKRNIGTADEIELALLEREAAKLGVAL